MAKPQYIELPTGERIPILYEDRSTLAIDKPRGWMLAPVSWQKTRRNLQAALSSSVAAGDFWARSRNLRFLRYVHRLDAETSGVLLFGKNRGAVRALSGLFQSREMEKVYLAVVQGVPTHKEWVCSAKLSLDSGAEGRIKVDPRHGKEAETHFRIVLTVQNTSLVEARPMTGRTHQIRVHLAVSGYPVVGDTLYGAPGDASKVKLGLRAISLAYMDPFTHSQVVIIAPQGAFLEEYGFGGQAQPGRGVL